MIYYHQLLFQIDKYSPKKICANLSGWPADHNAFTTIFLRFSALPHQNFCWVCKDLSVLWIVLTTIKHFKISGRLVQIRYRVVIGLMREDYTSGVLFFCAFLCWVCFLLHYVTKFLCFALESMQLGFRLLGRKHRSQWLCSSRILCFA